MKPENGMNLNEVTYFNLHDYIDGIKLSNDVLYHAYETSEEFDKYIKFLRRYPDSIILDHLIGSFRREKDYSNKMENHILDPESINSNNVYFDSLSMNNQRIKELHYFSLNNDGEYDYRKKEVNVSYYENGKEYIYWRGANSKYIQKFMDDFIKIYKEKGLSQLDSNPFFKASLMALLFVRIHPFLDGNGRTSRLIYDMKFTEMVNKIYNVNLKISPLHLSSSIFANRYTYGKTINNIYFDLEHDYSDGVNKWFEFMLNMNDEQLYRMTSDEEKERLDKLNMNKEIYNNQREIRLMKLKGLK